MKFLHTLSVSTNFLLRFAQNAVGLYRPYFAQWEVLYRCNMKCVFCNVYKDGTYDDSEIALPDALELLEELKKLGVIFLNFTGGEPLIKKDFVATLQKARSLGFFITMNTNGLLLKQFAPQIKDYVDSIHVSLDSDQPQVYEKLRGVENAFAKVIEGIKAAQKEGLHVAVNLTVNRQNFPDLRNFCEFAKSLRLDIFLTLVSVIPTEFKDSSQSGDLKISFEDYATAVRALKKDYPFIKTTDSYLDFVEKKGFSHYRCLAMKTTVNVKPDGSIAFPCGYFPKYKFDGRLNALRDWPQFQEATKVFRYDFCKDCTLSCFFAPTAMMDIRCWGPMIRSYLFSALRKPMHHVAAG